MPECLSCRKPAEYVFQVLEVRTLHIRDIAGESRVQVLGACHDFAVCRTCASVRLTGIYRWLPGLIKNSTFYMIAFLIGIIVLVLGSGDTVFRLTGLSAGICGVAGIISVIQNSRMRRKKLSALSEEEILREMAWECLQESAPRKAGEYDLTYIPVDRKTLDLKSADLALRYDLLPLIAYKAYGLIHEFDVPAS